MTATGPSTERLAGDVLAVPGVSRLYPAGATAALRAMTRAAVGGGGHTIAVDERDGTVEVRASIGTDGAGPAVDVALQAIGAVREALGAADAHVTIRIASVG